MKIRVGLVSPSSGWEQLLVQEGIPYSILDFDTPDIAKEYSVLAVNRMLGVQEMDIVEQYLKAGGAVIGSTHHLLHVAGVDGTEQKIQYIISNPEDIFPSIHLLDVGVNGLIPRGANSCRTDQNTFAIAAGELGGGYGVILPFEPGALLNDDRPATKNFYFKPERLPSERVSLVAKGELRHLVHRALKYLHHIRGIPYVHLWYFPTGVRNVFAFRVDSDGASREEIDTLYHIGRDHDVSMSWFVDVKAHEHWLDHFRYFVDQEIGLHCYEHQTYPTYDANLKNINKGLQGMRRAGLEPSGFTAPYGIWNPALAKAVDYAGFDYSSEFSFAYDTLPIVPATNEYRYLTPQIPVHPICIGSLAKVGYSETRMFEYFTTVIHSKISRDEPLFFYHHPSHRHWNVVRWLFNLRPQGMEAITLGDYARWWRRRVRFDMVVEYEGDCISVQSLTPDVPDDVYLRIVNTRGEEVILPIAKKINMSSILRWDIPDKPAPPPHDIRRAREFDPRQMMSELYDTILRKFK